MPPSRMIRTVTAGFGVAAAAGAAQLGIGYGLGVFSWLPTVHGADEAAWLASLAWTVWISATSVVIGSVAAVRAGGLGVGLSPLARLLWRTTAVLCSALGGLVVAVLTAVPSRVAQRSDTYAPYVIVGGYAIAGVLLGLVIALVAVNIPAVATNVLITSGWLWLLTTVATMDSLAAGRDLPISQLGVWRVTADGPWFQDVYVPGAALAGGSAFLIGALVAWPAVLRGTAHVVALGSTAQVVAPGNAAQGHAPRSTARAQLASGSAQAEPARGGLARVGIALSGAAGPALVAGSYLLAAPALNGVRPEQLSAHQIAPYAVLAGLIGSVLVAALAGRRGRGPARRSAGNDHAAGVTPQHQVAVDPV